MPLTIGLIGAGAGIGETIYGAIQKDQAQKAANRNVMPTYNASPFEAQSLALAGSQASTGMSDAARQQLLNNANTGLSTTIGAQMKMGGDANSLGASYENYNKNIGSSALYDDEARMKHLADYQGELHRQSAIDDKKWQINQYQPWANRSQAIAQQLAGGQNMMQSGFNTALSGITSGIQGYMNQPKAPQINNINQIQAPRGGGASIGDTSDYAAPLNYGTPTEVGGSGVFQGAGLGGDNMPTYPGYNQPNNFSWPSGPQFPTIFPGQPQQAPQPWPSYYP